MTGSFCCGVHGAYLSSVYRRPDHHHRPAPRHEPELPSACAVAVRTKMLTQRRKGVKVRKEITVECNGDFFYYVSSHCGCLPLCVKRTKESVVGRGVTSAPCMMVGHGVDFVPDIIFFMTVAMKGLAAGQSTLNQGVMTNSRAVWKTRAWTGWGWMKSRQTVVSRSATSLSGMDNIGVSTSSPS